MNKNLIKYFVLSTFSLLCGLTQAFAEQYRCPVIPVPEDGTIHVTNTEFSDSQAQICLVGNRPEVTWLDDKGFSIQFRTRDQNPKSPLYVLLKRNKYTYNRAGSGSATGNVLISTVVNGEKITHHFHITSN